MTDRALLAESRLSTSTASKIFWAEGLTVPRAREPCPRIADPATRRAALWLVMQVIRLAPTPRPTHALHLGYTAQDDFFGSGRHAAWAWLATQAREWSTPYRTRFWAGFKGPDDRLKGTNDSLEGTECH
jgi:hypothetical protein